MDAPLMFEILLYLNIYYFGVFAGSELLIVFAKYTSGTLYIPHIEIDAGVLGGILFSEFIKLASFQKIRSYKKGISNFVVLIFTAISIGGLGYIFFIQSPVIKIEYTVCFIMFLLLSSEVFFGILQLFPCCRKRQYEE